MERVYKYKCGTCGEPIRLLHRPERWAHVNDSVTDRHDVTPFFGKLEVASPAPRDIDADAEWARGRELGLVNDEDVGV